MADPVSFLCRLPPEERDALDAWATERGLSRNEAAREAFKLARAPQLAHTPSAKPKGVTPTALAPTLSKFGPKVDTSAVPYAGNLPSRYADRLNRK